MYRIFREAVAYQGVSVVISDRPCVLDPTKLKGPPFQVRAGGCNACQACMNLGCPALGWSDQGYEGRHKVRIDEAACIGCTLCVQVCVAGCIELADPEGLRAAPPGRP
jgi:indolepyruvate ferredoxin oxidoreductase alpha subunit